MISKLRRSLLGLSAAALALPAFGSAAALGPNPSLCAQGNDPSILVHVSGLKDRAGKIRVRTFTGNPDTYFNKKFAQLRVEYTVPSVGPVDICVPVPGPGTYAVDVRHDANNNGDTDRSDGVGASGNPKFSLFNILFGKKPPAREVQVSVGNGTTIVPIIVRYL
jgi:uncharacterized protein (DUF2141 family)